ncbi:MAG: hypothetical protein ABFC24_01685 [Methanoregulaceae archaeon]
MDRAKAVYWLTFIVTIIFAVIVSNRIASIAMVAVGLGGIAGLVVNFIVFAICFFGIIYVMGRFTGVNILGLSP